MPARRPLAVDVTSAAVSVVMPVRSAADTVGGQMAAIRRQLGPGDELIVVIDGPDPASEAAATRASGPHVRVEVLGRHGGISMARNAGVRLATCGRLAFCDADDAVRPGWLDAARSALDEHDVVSGLLVHTAFNARRVVARYPHVAAEMAPPEFGGVKTVTGGNFAVQRHLFDEVGGFDERLRQGEDLDLGIRLHNAGHPTRQVDEMQVQRRLRPTLTGQVVQAYRWGVAEPAVRRRHSGVIASDGAAAMAVRWARIARATLRARSRADLGRRLIEAATALGDLRGSILRTP